jgi:hypothetical protein
MYAEVCELFIPYIHVYRLQAESVEKHYLKIKYEVEQLRYRENMSEHAVDDVYSSLGLSSAQVWG